MVNVERVVQLFLSQAGDPYVFGYEIPPGTADPAAGDCSEYLQWATAMAGVDPPLPDGSWRQFLAVESASRLVPVPEGIDTRGALLFRFTVRPTVHGPRPRLSHVALSLGDGRTMEARSTRRGVGVFSAHGRGWTHAGLIPHAEYPADVAAPARPGMVTVHRSERGPTVRLVQGLLLGWGFGPAGLVDKLGLPDGVFGWRSASFVRAFQAGHGLVADAIVGPLTWAALLAPATRGDR